MLHRLRHASTDNFQTKKTTGVVQVDETFVGGKNKNRHAHKKVPESQGRSVKDKVPVFGMVVNGRKIRAIVVPDTKAKTLQPIIKKMINKGAIVISDEWNGYNGLAKDYKHVVINHSQKEFVRGAFHTNTAENFWSVFKRGYYGIYHKTSREHLQCYCDEIAYRYNTRDIRDNERFDSVLRKSDIGKLANMIVQVLPMIICFSFTLLILLDLPSL